VIGSFNTKAGNLLIRFLISINGASTFHRFNQKCFEFWTNYQTNTSIPTGHSCRPIETFFLLFWPVFVYLDLSLTHTHTHTHTHTVDEWCLLCFQKSVITRFLVVPRHMSKSSSTWFAFTIYVELNRNEWCTHP